MKLIYAIFILVLGTALAKKGKDKNKKPKQDPICKKWHEALTNVTNPCDDVFEFDTIADKNLLSESAFYCGHANCCEKDERLNEEACNRFMEECAINAKDKHCNKFFTLNNQTEICDINFASEDKKLLCKRDICCEFNELDEETCPRPNCNKKNKSSKDKGGKDKGGKSGKDKGGKKEKDKGGKDKGGKNKGGEDKGGKDKGDKDKGGKGGKDKAVEDEYFPCQDWNKIFSKILDDSYCDDITSFSTVKEQELESLPFVPSENLYKCGFSNCCKEERIEDEEACKIAQSELSEYNFSKKDGKNKDKKDKGGDKKGGKGNKDKNGGKGKIASNSQNGGKGGNSNGGKNQSNNSNGERNKGGKNYRKV